MMTEWYASTSVFIFVTLILGGGAAWLTGRAVAQSWLPAWRAVVWMLPLTAAVRFIHFALFGAQLLSIEAYGADFLILAAITLLGHRRARTQQMCAQYPWIYEPSGPLGWKKAQ